MTQIARPNSDGGDAEWVKQNGAAGALNPLIKEAVTDDTDYMKSTHASYPATDTQGWCMIKLATVNDPDPDENDHKIKYRAVGAGGMGPQLIVALYLGSPHPDGTEIITAPAQTLNSEDMGGTWADYTIDLDSDEAAAIGDNYDDLELWFKRGVGMMSSGGETVKVSQAWFECADVPEVVAATTSPAFLLFVD